MPVVVPSSPSTSLSPTSPYLTGRPSSSSSPTIHPYSPSLRPSFNQRGSLDSVSLFRLDPQEGDEDASLGQEDWDGVSVEGVRHVKINLESKQYQTPQFISDLLHLLRRLRIPCWSSPDMHVANVKIFKVSGSLTNAVFFVSYQPAAIDPSADPHQPLRRASSSLSGSTPSVSSFDPADAATLLLRIYGSTSSTFISRPTELRTLHMLSSVYCLGPALLGTFLNGRIEEFFPSRALTANELRDPEISRWIGRRMAELHTADLNLLTPHTKGVANGEREPTVLSSIRDWLGPAREIVNVLERVQREGETGPRVGTGDMGGRPELRGWVEAFNIDQLEREVEAYKKWLKRYEAGEVFDGKKWRMVFAHNDAQYGNLLKLNEAPKGSAPPHHAIIVVDFEYAAPNPLTHDIANHFCEWLADYHHPSFSHSLSHHAAYPTKDERWNFYQAYWEVSRGQMPKPAELEELDRGVLAWSPVGSAAWALWGVVSARAQVEAIEMGDVAFAPDFEYLLYALERVKMFRREIAELGISLE